MHVDADKFFYSIGINNDFYEIIAWMKDGKLEDRVQITKLWFNDSNIISDSDTSYFKGLTNIGEINTSTRKYHKISENILVETFRNPENTYRIYIKPIDKLDYLFY